MSLRTQWLHSSEIQSAMSVDRQVFNEGGWNASEFAYFMREPKHQILGLYNRQQLVGYMCLVEHRRRLDIARLVVPDEIHTSKSSLLLINQAKHFLPQDGRMRLEVIVAETNANAIRFFCRQGFVAEPWANGKYVREISGMLRFCYRLPRVPAEQSELISH